MFKAIHLSKEGEAFSARIAELKETDLPAGEVLVRVQYSTVNFKDALALTNRSPVVRSWPMVAGIDLAGVVEESNHPGWKKGDRVLVVGCGLGEVHWGGLSQKARLKAEWLTRIPASMSPRQAMAIGTAGFTSMLSLLMLERLGATPDKGECLVTGATGGVGSIAVAILAKRGYRVVASTGKVSEAEYLKGLGAAEIIDRASLSQPGKPLQKERWGSVVDSVGSHTLVNACAQTKPLGVVAACGLAQGPDFPATVMPFILRGVILAGVNSLYVPPELRQQAWDRLATDLDPGKLDSMIIDVGLAGAMERAPDVLAGKIRGRLVVDVDR